MVVHAKWNLVRYPIKVTVCLLWMMQQGSGCTSGTGAVTGIAAHLHDMIINAAESLFGLLAEPWSRLETLLTAHRRSPTMRITFE